MRINYFFIAIIDDTFFSFAFGDIEYLLKALLCTIYDNIISNAIVSPSSLIGKEILSHLRRLTVEYEASSMTELLTLKRNWFELNLTGSSIDYFQLTGTPSKLLPSLTLLALFPSCWLGRDQIRIAHILIHVDLVLSTCENFQDSDLTVQSIYACRALTNKILRKYPIFDDVSIHIFFSLSLSISLFLFQSLVPSPQILFFSFPL